LFIKSSGALFQFSSGCRWKWLNGSWRFLRRRDDFDHGCRRCGGRFQFFAVGVIEWSTRLSCQLRLLCCKTGMGRRRCAVGDHWPLEYAGRRLVTFGGGTTYAFFRRSDGRSKHHRGIGNVFPRYPMLCAGYRL